jgi:hypothetical protein
MVRRINVLLRVTIKLLFYVYKVVIVKLEYWNAGIME